jgi:iron complex transport system substrate-binding protein
MMMFSKTVHKRIAAAALAACAIVTAGCSDNSGDSDEQSATQTVQSVDGPVEIPADPQRVVALWGSAETLLTLDGPLVGVSDGKYTEATFGENTAAWERYESLPKVGSAVEPNYEKIAELNPDLILATIPESWWAKVDRDRLASIAPVANLMPKDTTAIADWKEPTFAEAAGVVDLSDAAAEKKAAYDARAEQIRSEHASQIEGKKVMAIASWDTGSFWLMPSGTYTAHIPEQVGMVFPEGEAEELSMERLGELAQYDVIVYPVQPDGTPTPAVQAILDSELFRTLPAATSNRLIPLAYDQQLNYDASLVALESIDAALNNFPS